MARIDQQETNIFGRPPSQISPCTHPLVDLHGWPPWRLTSYHFAFCLRRWHHFWCPGLPGCGLWSCIATSCGSLTQVVQRWKVSLSCTKLVVSFFSRDPREVDGKVIPKIYFGTTQVTFESTPKLLGVTLDSQLTFSAHVMEVRKKISSRLNVLCCTAGRSWSQHPASLRALYCTYTQSSVLYCASS